MWERAGCYLLVRLACMSRASSRTHQHTPSSVHSYCTTVLRCDPLHIPLWHLHLPNVLRVAGLTYWGNKAMVPKMRHLAMDLHRGRLVHAGAVEDSIRVGGLAKIKAERIQVRRVAIRSVITSHVEQVLCQHRA
jgi:hypothetical protein